jgi:hypothetical protein
LDDLNAQVQAFLEKREAERISARLAIRFTVLDKQEADRILNNGDFSDVFSADNLGVETDKEKEGVKGAFTENISISGLQLTGDLRLVGGQSVAPGAYLQVEIQIPDAPMPVRTLATVIWSEGDKENPSTFHAGLFFVGINKVDVMKVARFLILQRRAKQV